MPRPRAGRAPGVYTHACYSDIPPLYYGRGLADGEVPYIGQSADRQVEYPVLTGAVMWLTAQLVPSSDVPTDRSPLVLRHQRDRGSRSRAAVAVGATVRAGRPTAVGRGDVRARAGARAGRRRSTGTCTPWRCSPSACSPGRGRRPVAAGVLIGLAAATKFYPLFVLGPLLRAVPAGRPDARVLGHARGGGVRVGRGQRAGDAGRLRRVVEVLPASPGPRRRASARSGSCCRSRATPCPTTQLNVLAGGLFAVACLGDRGAGAVGRAPAAAAAAGVPRRGGVPADQQGLLAAVRAVADPAGGARPAALAGLPDLAGRRGRALRRHLAAARGLPAGAAGAGPRRRRLRPHRARRTCWPRCGCAR